MAKTTSYDPKRLLGGTIELVRDPKTGAYSTKTVGFSNAPAITLPQLGVTEVAKDATTTKTEADKALQAQTSAAFQSGGGGGGEPNRFLLPVDDDDGKKFSDLITQTSIENQEAQEKAAGIGVEPIKTPEIKTSTTIQDSMPRERKITDVGVPDYEDAILRGQVGVKFVEKDKFGDSLFKFEPKGVETARGRQPTEFTDAATRAAMTTDEAMRGTGGTMQTQERSDLPAPQDRALGISADPTGAAAVTQSQGPSDPRFRDQAASLGISADPTIDDETTKQAKSIGETIKDFTDNSVTLKIAKTGLMMGGKILGGIGDVILGVTDVDRRRRELDTAAAKSLGFRTRGELGASTDPGRIAMSPADHVLGGKNRDSALGNLSESGAKRIQRRMTTGLASVEKRYGKDSKRVRDYKEKTRTFQRQMNEFNTEKEKKRKEKAQNPNLRSGAGKEGGGTSGGKIVCTMMNESYGFGSFRNKIWMKFHKDISPEYQKGYHKLFLPLVRYAKQKGITNKFIKNILEHIAVHSTIDMRQSLRGKRHTLGIVYRKIILPLCYWAGKK
jgi:hypothetical protein